MNTEDNNDKANAVPAETETPEENLVTEGVPRSPARGLWRLFVLLVLVLVLGGLAAAGWFGWQWLQNERAGMAAVDERQAAQLAELTERLNGVARGSVTRNDFEAIREEMQADLAALRETSDRIANEMQALREAARGGRRDLVLGEIEYLLRVAADALYLTNDIDTAIYALQAADDRLRQLGEPRLNPVRERIADHLQALNAVRMPDVQGMAIKLGSMMRQVSALPLQQTQHARATGEAVPAADGEVTWWQRLRGGLQRVFNKLVVVQQAERPQPLLDPEESFFLYRNLELQLAAARAALLSGDANSYRQSLELAREWLSRYFDTRDGAVQNMIADISGLLDVPLQPELPDINPALERFRALNGARAE